jgi:hypothetical protein
MSAVAHSHGHILEKYTLGNMATTVNASANTIAGNSNNNKNNKNSKNNKNNTNNKNNKTNKNNKNNKSSKSSKNNKNSGGRRNSRRRSSGVAAATRLIQQQLPISQNGKYDISIHVNGDWKVITIDDRLPCLSTSSATTTVPSTTTAPSTTTIPTTTTVPTTTTATDPALSRLVPAFGRSSTGNELWVPLLEKAIAKHYGR